MFFEVNFTGGSYRVGADPVVAPEEFILDLGLHATSLTLVARCLELSPTAADPALLLDLETSMDLQDGQWFSLGSFNPLVKTHDFHKRDFTGLLRYVRWVTLGLSNASAATFQIFGIAR
jgi:hypothetical protein